MKKNRSATQTQYLKSCIEESFFELLKDSSLGQISITSIAHNAGVSRMTIYRYYDEKEDIVRSHMRDSYNDYLNMARESGLGAIELAPYFFAYFRRSRRIVELLMRKSLFHLISENFAEYVEEYSIAIGKRPNLPGDQHSYYYAYTAAGILSMVKLWIENGMKESDEEMAAKLKNVKAEQANFQQT